ncbi:MAG: rod shape-determining protein MreC [Anaerolineae bacterium]|nr:rod shape-determining protein MreC [Anaerolineae bacterium]HPD40838.1 rod shape-determining protein MreC [Anaerolineae bacterium]HRT31089.1 rod shape-determining protein MreC [Anaerolineae bacterium]HXK42841.1 rod shape-determining protein MreC [Anaerolineae bacterium]
MTRRGRPWWPYILMAAALLLLALNETGLLSPVEEALSFVISPIERGVASIVRAVGDVFQGGQEARELQELVATLQQENETLRIENIRLQEQYVAENEQLRGLLDFKNANPTFRLVGADVVARGQSAVVVGQDTNPYLGYLIINAGSRDGVAIGMPVVASGAVLVGRIARVSPHLAYVQLLNDPTSQVAALLQGSRASGLVVGREDPEKGNLLIMTEILPDETVAENEIVITSGLGGLLPQGLVLGQVESVSYQESALFQEAVVRPALDYRRLEAVVVLLDFERPPVEELKELLQEP